MTRPSTLIQALSFIALCAVSAQINAADYRGMAPGWPNYTNGAYAANYPANYGTGPAYYVARPVSATAAYYGGAAPSVAYMPVRAAYSNPTYFAAYGVPPGRAPVAAYYPGATTAYYAPQQAYYAPVTANYAPSYSYAVSPAGSVSAGSEASLAYAQPTNLNYVPARVAYRPAYAAVPVYAYQPLTAYQPTVIAQPATCYQPATYQPATCGYQPAATSPCQSQRHPLSFLNPFNWFRRSCGYSGCGSAPATTAYCTSGCQTGGCGQPYYPTQPAIPVIPAPAAAPTFTPVPSGSFIPPATRTIPPPPTRTPGTLNPADLPPRITPGGSFTPVPGATTTPGTTLPGGSFPTTPNTTTPGFGTPGSFNPGTSFPSGTNYPPSTDPYSSSTSPTKSTLAPSATHSSPLTSSSNVLRAPELGSPLAPGVSTVPDPDAQQKPQPINRAPQLLDLRDRSASASVKQRWAVVPAVWPTKTAKAPALAPVTHQEPRLAPANPADYDDRGWKSAAGL